MARTNMISDALSIANRGIPRPIEDDHAAYIANIALNEMWLAYDWRETLAALPPFYLIPMIQDYGAPFYAVPADYYGLREAYLVDTNSNPLFRSELKIIRNLRKEYSMGYPRDIGYIPEIKSFRVYPMVPASFGASQYLVDGQYKKLAPQVTATTLQNTQVPWDDIYLSHFVTALRWAAAEAADSPAKSAKKGDLYSGLMDMAGREGLELGDQVISPSEPLVGSGGYNTGIYPGIF